MNKVLLLDDRLERQKILMDDSELGELKKCEENGWLTILSELELRMRSLKQNCLNTL